MLLALLAVMVVVSAQWVRSAVRAARAVHSEPVRMAARSTVHQCAIIEAVETEREITFRETSML